MARAWARATQEKAGGFEGSGHRLMIPSFREKGKRRKDTGSRSGANLKGAVMSLKTLSVPKHVRDPLLPG